MCIEGPKHHTPLQYRGDLRGSKDHIRDLVHNQEMEEQPLSSKYLRRISNNSVSRSVSLSTRMTALCFALLVGGAEGISVCQECSSERNLMQLSQQAPSEFLSFNDTFLPANQTNLLKRASQELSLPLNNSSTPRQIVDGLLSKMMACDPDPSIRSAEGLLNTTECGNGVTEETTETVRHIVSHICRTQTFDGCSEVNVSSRETFNRSLHEEIEDLKKIYQRSVKYPGCKDDSCYFIRPYLESDHILSVTRKLLSLQREFKDYYIFTHGMGCSSAWYPRLIGEIDRRLYPEHNSQDFIFIRALPGSEEEIPLSDILYKIENGMTDEDEEIRDSLLPVDIDPLHTEFEESALYYYDANRNIQVGYGRTACKILATFAKAFHINFRFRNYEYLSDIASFHEAMNKEENEKIYGHVLAIAVPKSRIQDPNTTYAYLSWPHGYPLTNIDWSPLNKLFRDNREEARLRYEKMQTNWTVWEEFQKGDPYNNWWEYCISARLVTSHLRPENGVRTFWIGEQPQSEEVAQVISVVADNFFKHVVQRCQERDYDDRAEKNAECERLLTHYHL